MKLSDKFKEYATVVVVSLAGSALVTYFLCQSCHENGVRYFWVTVFSTCLWVSLWIGNGELAHFLNKKISWMKYPIRRLVVGVVVTVLYTVSVVMLLTKSWEYIFNFSFGGYLGIVLQALIITFVISLFLHGRGFLIGWRQTAVDAERMKQESVKAQYESLRNQVNPHFLFNSLNALSNLVHQNPEKAVTFIKELSDVYRYVLDTRDREVVPIAEEMKFVESYLYLQKIRFGDKLKVELSTYGTEGNVAPLAIQMLLENAIKHNEISDDRPLTVRINIAQGYVIVENTQQAKKVLKEDSPGVGLDNIKRRYELLAERPITVEETGGVFRVSVPLVNVSSS